MLFETPLFPDLYFEINTLLILTNHFHQILIKRSPIETHHISALLLSKL